MQGGSGGGAAPPRMLYLYLYLHSISRFMGHQNGWSFSISRKAGYIRMVGPSVFPDTRVLPEWLDFQYFQMHELYKNGLIFSISRFTSSQNGLSFSISRFPGNRNGLFFNIVLFLAALGSTGGQNWNRI